LADYVKAKTATTAPLADGSHQSLEPGEPIAVDQLSENMQESLHGEGSNADWVSNLFEASSQEDYDKWQAGHRTFDQGEFDRNRLNQMGNIVLPGPDEVVVYNEEGAATFEPAPPVLAGTVAQSSAVVTEGAEADEELNANVGTSEPSPSPADAEEEQSEEGGTPEQETPPPPLRPQPRRCRIRGCRFSERSLSEALWLLPAWRYDVANAARAKFAYRLQPELADAGPAAGWFLR
jgi:hypothetical protein